MNHFRGAVNDFRAGAALFVVVVAFFVGAYVGIVEVLVVGIKQIVDGVKADPTDGGAIAWGLVKVWLLWEFAWAAITAGGIGVAAVIWPKKRPRPQW